MDQLNNLQFGSKKRFNAKKRYLAVLLASLFTLSACDGTDESKSVNGASNDKKPVENSQSTTKNTNQTGSQQKNAKTVAKDAQSIEALAKRFAGKDITILDASELQIDGANAMVVTFSVPLDPNQDFSQFARLIDIKNGKLDGAWELSDNLMELRMRHLPPSSELQLTVDTGLKGVNGRTLGSSFTQKVTTAAIVPSVGFASRGSLLPTKVAEGLPVLTQNVDSVDVNFYRIKGEALASFIAGWQNGSNMQYWNSDDMLNNTELVYTGRFDLSPEKNTRETVILPLKDIKQLQQEGVYFAVMQQAGRYSYNMPATLFTLSDIGVSLHSYLNEVDVFAQSLESGSGIKDVELQLLDEKGQLLAKATTDGDGHAKLEKNDKAKVLMATKNGQTSIIDFNRPALDLSEFDIAGPQGHSKQFFVFGPRDLYRPGETLILNALLRDGNGNPIKTQPVKVDVLKNDGSVERTFVWQPQEGKDGLYQYQYEIPKNADTGKLTLRFDLGGNAPQFYSVNVEDFMPERLALDLTNGASAILTHQDAEFEIKGRYLYGAPAAGNQLQGQLFMRADREAVAKLPGFEFGNILEENLRRNLDEFDMSLNDDGETDMDVSKDYWQSVRSPVKLILQASLLESGGRPVTRRAEQAIWPTNTLVGIRPLFEKKEIYDYSKDRYQQNYSIDENSLAEFEIVLADITGKKHQASDLNVRLVYERRDYYWRWSDSEGWASGFDQKDLVVSNENIQIDADKSAKVTLPVDWGSYRIEVEDPQTGVVTSLRFWAGYSWQDNTSGTGAVRPDQVKLALDKPSYLPGEKVKLNITAPQAGKGYVLLESSDGPLWWKEIEVPEGGTILDIPLNKEWARHDLYASAVIIRPGDTSRQAMIKRAVGILHIPLADPNRKINLSLTAPEKMRPNTDLKVKIKANAQDGKPLPEKVHVILSAVDTGVLNITDYKTPDPYDAFFGRKRYSVDQYDVYGQLIEGQGRVGQLKFGGDGEADLDRGGLKPITDVQIIAEQAQPVTLDENGEGYITLPVPDFNGELRLMAQAWTEKDFGHAQDKVVIAAPVITQMSLPRFMAGGDSAELALDLTNLTDETQHLTLNFKTTGMINLKGSAVKEITLEKGKRNTITIPVTAANGFGEGEVFLTMNGLNIPNENIKQYENSWKMGVRPAHPAETITLAKGIQANETWEIPTHLYSALIPSTLEGQLLLTSRPPLDISRFIKELYAYPYGCLEQTVSGLYPSLYSSEAELKKLGIKTQTDASRHASIERGISHLLTMQRSDGSFSLWNKNGDEEFWLTAYATDFLYRASQRGYSVPVDALESANNRLLRYLQDSNMINARYYSTTDAMRFSVQAYAGLVLANQQKAPLGALRQIYQRRDNAGNGLSLVQLGIALQKMGDKDRGAQAIKQGSAKTRVYGYDLGDYGSTIRDDAMIIALLSELDDQQKIIDGKLLQLSNLLTSREYYSTQESNAIYLAGRNFINKTEKPWQATLNHELPALSSEKAMNEALNSQQLLELTAISNQGEGVLYSRINIVGYPQNAPKPSSNVLNIKRTYLDLQGNSVRLDRMRSGEMVYVKLEVTADRRVPDALVVDLLPAGLELENQNLANSSAGLNNSGAAEIQEAVMDMQQSTIRHTEFRDDRYVAQVVVEPYNTVTLVYLARAVTSGVYTIPAPQVESMYVPDWRAIGVTPTKLEVVR